MQLQPTFPNEKVKELTSSFRVSCHSGKSKKKTLETETYTKNTTHTLHGLKYAMCTVSRGLSRL